MLRVTPLHIPEYGTLGELKRHASLLMIKTKDKGGIPTVMVV